MYTEEELEALQFAELTLCLLMMLNGIDSPTMIACLLQIPLQEVIRQLDNCCLTPGYVQKRFIDGRWSYSINPKFVDKIQQFMDISLEDCHTIDRGLTSEVRN